MCHVTFPNCVKMPYPRIMSTPNFRAITTEKANKTAERLEAAHAASKTSSSTANVLHSALAKMTTDDWNSVDFWHDRLGQADALRKEVDGLIVALVMAALDSNAGLSMRQIAQQLDVSEGTVRRIVNGKRKPL